MTSKIKETTARRDNSSIFDHTALSSFLDVVSKSKTGAFDLRRETFRQSDK